MNSIDEINSGISIKVNSGSLSALWLQDEMKKGDNQYWNKKNISSKKFGSNEKINSFYCNRSLCIIKGIRYSEETTGICSFGL